MVAMGTYHSGHGVAIGTYHSSHWEEVGVVATLLQIHHDVEQRHLVPTPLGVECLEVPREDELVVLPAAGRGGEERRSGHQGTTVPERTLCSAGRPGASSQHNLQETRGGLESPSKLLGTVQELGQPQP